MTGTSGPLRMLSWQAAIAHLDPTLMEQTLLLSLAFCWAPLAPQFQLCRDISHGGPLLLSSATHGRVLIDWNEWAVSGLWGVRISWHFFEEGGTLLDPESILGLTCKDGGLPDPSLSAALPP